MFKFRTKTKSGFPQDPSDNLFLENLEIKTSSKEKVILSKSIDYTLSTSKTNSGREKIPVEVDRETKVEIATIMNCDGEGEIPPPISPIDQLVRPSYVSSSELGAIKHAI